MLSALPDHISTILISAATWQILMSVSQFISWNKFSSYRSLSAAKRHQWDIRMVSFAHAILSCSLAFQVLDLPELKSDPLFGYSWYAGQVFAISVGFFLWDSLISAYHIKEYGPGFLIHGVFCFSIYLFAFTPFAMYYGSIFLLYELSTPFLNIHWILDKMNLTGSIYQWVNGIALVLVFFSVRIACGFPMSFYFLKNIYLNSNSIPLIHKVLYLVANVVLNSLNLFWFSKMITALRKRASSSKISNSSRNPTKKINKTSIY